jgi:TonB-dependent receptor
MLATTAAVALMSYSVQAAEQAHGTAGSTNSDAAAAVGTGQVAQAVLGGTAQELIEVTGQRPSATGSLPQARQEQKAAPNLINVQPQSEIEKLPDVSVAEALQRIPGISLESDTGEGRFINIRGLDADLNGSTFDNVRLPPSNFASPFNGARAVAFDTIPASFVGGLEVTKTNRPDQDAEALGGTINILPRTQKPDGAPFVEATLGFGLEPLRNTPIYQGDLAFGATFGVAPGTGPFDPKGKAPVSSSGFFTNPKPFGIIATGSVYDDSRGVDDIEAAYSDQQGAGVPDKVLNQLDTRRYTYQRTRYGYGGEFSFNPNDLNSFYLRANEFGYNEHINRARLTLNNLDNANGDTDANGNAILAFLTDPNNKNGFIAPDAQLQKSLRDEGENVQDQVFELGGNSVVSGIRLDYKGSWARGIDNKPFDINPTFTDPNAVVVAYDNSTNPSFPKFHVLNGVDPANSALYNLTSINNSTFHDFDTEWGGQINATVPLNVFGSEGEVKVGGSLRLRKHNVNQTSEDFAPAAGVLLPLANLSAGQDFTFYDGTVHQGDEVNSKAVEFLVRDPNNLVVRTRLTQDRLRDLAAFQLDNENVYAGYGQYTGKLGNFGLLAGLRIEATDASYGANSAVTDANGNVTVTPNTNKQSYTDVFPTVQGTYNFSDNLIARLTYSTAIARPGFNQISASQSIDLGALTVSSGNPNLKPTTGNNFDLSVEYYLNKGGIISFGAFDKEFEHYTVQSQVREFFPASGDTTDIFSVNTFQDVGHAQAYGTELNYNQHFTFLPAPLDAFGFNGNYTYVQSSFMVRPGQFEQLPSTSRTTFNASIFYEKGPFEADLGASFVSKNLFAVGPSAQFDTWSQPRFRLDLGTKYTLNENFSFFFDVKNLTDTTLKFTEGSSGERPIQREFYGPTFTSGVKMRF